MIAFNTAAMGAINAAQRFDKAAVKSVSEASAARDVVSAFVEQKDARTAFEASLQVLKTSDEMTGRLLNIKV
ncbi:flagellar basal body rod protein [Asticcacaulis sp. BYS171W]|uniref:Flagellar basal body rod protein n=1 Tax=Asticcacaulis aquaticus TaxID=2984212 RepID=A0ABT5HQX1_9CAUL|nr:flagellar basal body rod protein [Asticcacaulis aquaticus]MDC7682458.1 flagellar basal body rod protein [Asticcacaulis aquaticus]